MSWLEETCTFGVTPNGFHWTAGVQSLTTAGNVLNASWVYCEAVKMLVVINKVWLYCIILARVRAGDAAAHNSEHQTVQRVDCSDWHLTYEITAPRLAGSPTAMVYIYAHCNVWFRVTAVTTCMT